MLKHVFRVFNLLLMMILPIVAISAEMDNLDAGTSSIVKKRVPVKINGKKSLPLRIVTRPFSNIYKDKSVESGIVRNNVPALQPYYVYTKPSAEDLELEEGWYEVGANGKVIGWMRSKDVLEWKQTMSLVFKHPEGRKPVLMFDSKSALDKIIGLSDEERIEKVNKIYSEIDEHNISKNFPVVSMEPKKAVDIHKEFYLLPILDFQSVDFGRREGMVLKLTAVTNAKAGARDISDIRTSDDYLDNVTSGKTKASRKVFKKLPIDIVWVVDTTVSMRPYIQDTLELVRSVSSKIGENSPDNVKLKFGIWGYRDSVDDIPEIGYTTKNYTPELVDVKNFVNVLSNVKTTNVDSVDYPEDMFSGISDAMEKTAWEPEAVKLIILVGDAPSHTLGHKWNLSGQYEETLRTLANDQNIYIAAFYINNPKAEKFHELALTQYQKLATNPGSKDSYSFDEILSTNKEAFRESADKLANVFVGGISNMRRTVKPPSTSKTPSTEGELALDDDEMIDIDTVIPEVPMTDKTMTGMGNRMFRAALVQWIGSQTDTIAPRDIVAWSTDKDLINPDIQSMEVKILINKRQLDSLAMALNLILKGAYKGQRENDKFFTSLQAVAASMARDPDKVKRAKTLAETGLVPEFLIGLPYKSQVMAMTDDMWRSLSADEQGEFIKRLEAKLELYGVIHDSPKDWIALNKGDDEDEYVYPLDLDLLP